jgi:AmmeMemoRadiSam system protein B
VAILLLICTAITAHAQQPRPPFPAFYPDPTPFLASLRAVEDVRPQRVTGITVPHHLLAADVIAHGFRAAAGGAYDKVVVLFPDHFKKARTAFATTLRDFDTAFGRIRTAQADVAALLRQRGLVETSDLFGQDHGIGAVIPYVRHLFPDAAIVPIAVSIRSQKADWDRLVPILAGIVTDRTLVVQSTDFSHFLPQHVAVQRDQEVLNILSAGDTDAVAALVQPRHTDSKGSQYIQMRLQRERFGARPVVVANSNAQRYSDAVETETTSYVVQLYAPGEPRRAADQGDHPGSRTFCFAGDTAFSRHLLQVLADRVAASRLRDDMLAALNGCPLILNLEGVVVPELPSNLGPLQLAMPADLTLRWLKSLNVVAVSVANNHAHDLGDEAYRGMVSLLREAGIRVLEHGTVEDFGAFRLAALSDLDNAATPQVERITPADIERLAQSGAAPPLAVFVHWGVEYSDVPSARERALADALRRQAVSLIVGAHPHRAGLGIEALAGGEAQLVYSLGNFLFDQLGERVSGTLLEVRAFEQGTYFTRLIPLPNFYKDALRPVR